MPSNHLIFCRPLLLLSSNFLSIRVFSNESVFHIRSPKYWSFSFSISPSNEYSGLISFWRDWLDLLAGRGTLKSLKATVRSLQLVRMAIVKETGNNKCWRGGGEKGGLVFCCWECTLGQPLGKTVWRFLKIWRKELPRDPAMPLLSIYPKNVKALILKNKMHPYLH